jgi:formate hydrogenlyase transcriptional activator
MSFADRREAIGTSVYWLSSQGRRYGFALVTVALATALRYLLGPFLGPNAPFLLFYPAVMLVAWMAGLWPGVFAVIVSAVSAIYLFFGQTGTAAFGLPHNATGLMLFAAAGVGISGLAHVYRLRAQRLREFERAAGGVEEGIIILDRRYRYVVANRVFLAYRGMSRKQLIGRSLAEVMGPDVFEATVKSKLDECFQGKVVKFEKRYRYPAMGERDFSVSYFPIEGPTGIDRVACILQDITEQKDAERGLKLFRTLIDQCNESVEVVDPDTLRFLDVNEKTCKDLGYSREELLKMSVLDINPYLDESTLTKVRAALDRSGCLVREGFHRRKDGTKFPVETGIKLIHLDRSYVVAVSRDTTDRRRAEASLRESEDRYRDLIEHSEDLVCTHDLAGNLLSVNPAPARVLGYEVDELLKMPMRELLAPETREQFDAYLHRIQVTGADQGVMTVLTRSGERRIWQYNNTLRREGVPSPIVRGMAHDVTERMRAEKGRKAAERSLAENEERFRVALKDSPITVFNQDRDLRYTWIYNPQFHGPKDFIGKTDDEILGPETAARLNELKRRVLTTGQVSREEVVIPIGNKSSVFDLTIEPLLDAEGNVIGITAAAVDIARLREMTDRLQEAKEKLTREKSYLEGEIQAELGFEEIIGQSSALRDVLKKARVVAPTDSTVLLLGETGTGKELVARAIHALSGRHARSFIKLNCAAVPSGLLESELFGHEKGAFTGAVSQKVGRIELADKGTLFLDEIGELPVELQPKLLRVLQDREFERLGGVHTLHVDVRIISATNCDLHQDIAEKKFREDLFYRLNVFPIQLPALRNRKSDIPVLVHHFVHKHATRMGKHIEIIPSETMDVLQNWNWPGNIRELENMIERMVILSKSRVLADPPAELDGPQVLDDDNLTEMEREHIIRVLRETHGVLSGVEGAASRLGIKRTTLQSMLKRFHIELGDYRRGTGTFGSG